MKTTSKKERIVYFQKLVDQKLTLDQIKADKEVQSWGLADSTIERYAIECDYVEQAEAINSELDSDTQKPMPKPPVIKIPVFNEQNEAVELDRIMKLFEKSVDIYSNLIKLRLQAKKSTTRLVGFRKKANNHAKHIRDLQKEQARRKA
ncbi:MAG: hypothetical protein ABIJ97_17535 [Bacteroidota bacterium]